jgi:hypothetical protein
MPNKKKVLMEVLAALEETVRRLLDLEGRPSVTALEHPNRTPGAVPPEFLPDHRDATLSL